MPVLNKEELDKEQVLTLYAVNRAPKGVPTKTHYQKMMYLIIKALGNDPRDTAGYRPHHFGPYSDMVEDWRDSLIENGWLAKNSHERITIPESLKQQVDRISFPDPVVAAKVDSIVRFICSLTYNEVLLYVYADDVAKGEGMTDSSDVKEGVFKRRIPLALSMVRRGKVSVAKGAELADMDVGSFMKLLGRGKSV